MNPRWISSSALVIGMILGPFVFLSLREQLLVNEWWNVAVILLISAGTSALVVGLPVLLRYPRFEALSMETFLVCSSASLGIGVTSIATAMFVGEFGPVSATFFGAGAGLMIGAVFANSFLQLQADITL